MATHDIITAATTTIPTTNSEGTTAPSWAYVTFLAGNGDCVKGVVGLAKGLRKVKSKYPLVVAVLPDVPKEHREILVSQGCIVREIQPVHPPENQTQFARAYYVINHSKLRIWEFVEYSKMIYLDGDIQVFENIDPLFDYPDNYFYAPMECFCDGRIWSHSPQYKIGYCQHCPDKVQWDIKMAPHPPLYFNAGMFVYEPSCAIYVGLLNTLKNSTPLSPFDHQDLLNMYFKDTYMPLPYTYYCNLSMPLHHPENKLDKAKVVHFCANESKPWRYSWEQQQQIKELVEKWWDIDESLGDDNNDVALEFGKEQVNLQPLMSALFEATDLDYVSTPSAA